MAPVFSRNVENIHEIVPATQGETLRDPHPPIQLYVDQVFANKDALYAQVAHHSAQQDMASSMWGLRKKAYRTCVCSNAKTTGCQYLVRARATGVPDAWRITELRLQHTCKPGELAPRVGALRYQFREHQLRSSGAESETKSKTAISLVEQQTGVQMTRRSTYRTLNGLSGV
ncbi:hypothetical protein B9479_008214 [Cryptococcus floricola]|uniref:Uncharacterized protein n=1 Tax=Cryptococcus floricola TaxID=2591691 RepID=A0A5D3AKP6_9TREE|nr:hypothetical protein B9479_008214 [Cryptococcus floricola]